MTFDCNECNEALEEARAAVSTARRLALVAENALANGDLRCALAALRNLHDATARSPGGTACSSQSRKDGYF